MAKFLQNLKDKFVSWLATKAILLAFDQLSKQHLGKRLNTALDAKYGKSKTDPIQKTMAVWLRQVAAEVEA